MAQPSFRFPSAVFALNAPIGKRGDRRMIPRILIHTVIATLLVGTAALSWQAAVKGQGFAATLASLAGDHDDDD